MAQSDSTANEGLIAGGNARVTIGNAAIGRGASIGQGAQAQISISEGNREEILRLLEQLRDEIQTAAIPDGARNALARSIPDMQQAAQTAEPQPGLKSGLTRINDQLEAAGAVAGNVSGIVQTMARIAEMAGLGITVVAPFVASLL